jgi:hypothetical protein
MKNNNENVINKFNNMIENLFKKNFDESKIYKYIDDIKNIFNNCLNEIESENEKKSNNNKKRKIIENEPIIIKIPKEIEKKLKIVNQ